MHSLDEAAAVAGSFAALAAEIGVSASTPSMWKARGSVPPEYCLAVERASGGRVTRADLRPDDYWLIWPDLKPPGTDCACFPGSCRGGEVINGCTANGQRCKAEALEREAAHG
jgi:DNA-binding transcriptional regulator YdaS (Cro superfamily)